MKVPRTTDGRLGGNGYGLAACLLAAVLAAAPGGLMAQAFKTTTGHAEFTSSVPLHTFTGTSERLNGRIDLAVGTVDFYLDLETLDTGIGKRDKDMRKTLDTASFPFAEFVGQLESPIDPASRARQAVRVRGTFTIHGVAREIVVEGSITPGASSLRLEAAWELLLADYDIVPPSLLFVKVDQVQKVALNALLTPETP